MMRRDPRSWMRFTGVACALFFLSAPLRAQQGVSERLREKAKQAQSDLQLLEKSKIELSSTASQQLLDEFGKEIEAKKGQFASIESALKESETLETDIRKIRALKDQLRQQGSPEFLAALANEIARDTARLQKIAAAADKLAEAPSPPQPENREMPSAQSTSKEPAKPQSAASSAVGKAVTPSLNPIELPPAVITGKATKGSSVQIKINGKSAGKADVDKNGNFKLPVDSLQVGDQVEAEQENPQGSTTTTVTKAKDCEETAILDDCRPNFEADFYTGLSIDTFAANDLTRYFNEDATKGLHERAVGGFDFAYRLLGDPKRLTDQGREVGKWNQQLWIYGETVHGARSTTFDCTKTLCGAGGSQLLYILRNATTLEAFTGVRWEFLTLNAGRNSPANLYFESEYGFLTVSGSAGKLVNENKWAALGLMATKGRYRDSYLEIAFGRSDVMATNPHRRLKLDAFLTWDAFHTKGLKYLRPFAELTVDKSLGSGASSVQSFVGIDFDLSNLIWGNPAGVSPGTE